MIRDESEEYGFILINLNLFSDLLVKFRASNWVGAVILLPLSFSRPGLCRILDTHLFAIFFFSISTVCFRGWLRCRDSWKLEVFRHSTWNAANNEQCGNTCRFSWYLFTYQIINASGSCRLQLCTNPFVYLRIRRYLLAVLKLCTFDTLCRDARWRE